MMRVDATTLAQLGVTAGLVMCAYLAIEQSQLFAALFLGAAFLQGLVAAAR